MGKRNEAGLTARERKNAKRQERKRVHRDRYAKADDQGGSQKGSNDD
ncbi:hypothetical protein GCM10009798_23310 [Nocardioides panacihumi]|uniref:Uncharacterized protein n=1 Tax=Nocardioides panacihumi TaxID=400774 RepID=A0ABN2R390_9ACTN